LTNTNKSRVYALFDDGTADEIIFQYFGAPLSQDIPIRAYSNNIHDLDVQQSVHDGAAAALSNYEKNNKSIGERYCFAYKLFSDSTNQAITGKSAGLAFCLKFAQKLYKSAKTMEQGFSVAATGVIETDENQNSVKPVEKINKKLEGVLKTLDSGDMFIYPSGNEQDIDPKLVSACHKKGISVVTVETVEEAIHTLFDIESKGKPISKGLYLKKMHKRFWLYLFIAALGLILYFLFFQINATSCYDKVISEIQNGEYLNARDLAEACLKKTYNDSLDQLKNRLESPLNISADFIYIKNSEQNELENTTDSPLLLSTNDGYRFEIAAPENCYLYIFQFDSGIGSEKLFPLSAFILNQQYIEGNRINRIPGGENMFYLDDPEHHGTVSIFIVASPWRLTDIEMIYTKYEDSEGSEGQRNFRDALIDRIQSFSDLENSEIRCLFVKKLTFIQQ